MAHLKDRAKPLRIKRKIGFKKILNPGLYPDLLRSAANKRTSHRIDVIRASKLATDVCNALRHGARPLRSGCFPLTVVPSRLMSTPQHP